MMSRALIIIFMGVMVLEIKRGVDWQRLSAKLFCIGFFAVLLYIVFKYAASAFLPFFIAYAVSLIVNPLSSATATATGIPRKLCAVVYVTVFITTLFAVVFFAVRRLVVEAQSFILVGGGLDRAVAALSDVFSAVGEKIPLGEVGSFVADIFGGGISGFLSELEKNAADYIGGTLARLVPFAVSRAPSIFIFAVVTVMSCYYFCVDQNALSSAIKKAIPVGYRERLAKIVSLAASALKRYLRAYLILMLITFCEVYLGLAVLRVKYALLIAVGIAFVDILPILGAGTVLVPWAAVCLFSGDIRLGVGLLMLYGIVTIVRQISEPGVVGKSVGIHPVISLISMYAGFKLFGFLGMVLGPLCAFLVSELTKN